MPFEIITAAAFIDDFLGAVYRYDFRRHPYTLVLGAGASRSAGIPLASEMTRALTRLAKGRRLSLGELPSGESALSWHFRKVFGSVKQASRKNADARFVSSGRAFLLSCIGRAQREANLTHLIAADLGVKGIFNPIVTTNFDDLTLAAFWDLPNNKPGPENEAHVIYDPRSALAEDPQIAEGVAVIIKAHGHHTTYGLGILDKQVRALAPHVRKLLTNMPQPVEGYVVVGYSGAWDDGVIRVLRDPELTRGKTIYWLFQGSRRPRNEYIDQVLGVSNVKFVRILDSDVLFIRLWNAIPEDEHFSIGISMDPEQLFSSPASGHLRYRKRDIRAYREWFNPTLVQRGDEPLTLEEPAKLEKLREELLPIIKRIDYWDNRHLVPDSIFGGSDDSREREGIDTLERLVPVDIAWTRRNRTLLRLGLSADLDLYTSTLLLSGLCALDTQA